MNKKHMSSLYKSMKFGGRKRKPPPYESQPKRRRIRGRFHKKRSQVYQPSSGLQTYGHAKVGYQLKKYGGRPRISRQLLSQLYGENTVPLTYLDRVTVSGTTGQAANQALWASRVSYDAAISSATQTYIAPMFNLVVHDPIVLNRLLVSTGPGTLTQTTSGKTSKLFVKSYSVEACLTNLQNGPIEVWEYRLIARTRITLAGFNTVLNTLNDPLGLVFVNGATGGNMIQPPNFTVPQATVTFPFSASTTTQLGITPYMIPGLTKYFKISGVQKKLLAPEERWCIKYKSHKPMIYDNEKFNLSVAPDISGSSTNPTLWAGQGLSLFIMKGTFALDQVGATAQKIGIGGATVGIEYKHRVHWANISQNYMSSALIRDAPGFTTEEAGYPGSVMRVVNLNAISTGPTPDAAGTNVWNANQGQLAIPDDAMDDED